MFQYLFGPLLSNFQATLQDRGGQTGTSERNFPCLVQHSFVKLPAFVLFILIVFQQNLGQRPAFLGLPKLDQLVNFLVVDQRALHPAGLGRIRVQEQHVALTQQSLRTNRVQDHPRVDLGSHGESYARRNVRLEKAGDHVYRRALSGQHQVNSCSPPQLGKPDQVLLDFESAGHHQVGQFVNYQQQKRHGFFCLGVIAADVPHPALFHLFVTPEHFLHQALEGGVDLFHVDDYRHDQVRNAVEGGKFHPLGIDHQHTQLVRRLGQEQGRNH